VGRSGNDRIEAVARGVGSRLAGQLARPALNHVERAGRSGLLVDRSEIAQAQRLAGELHTAQQGVVRLREAARQRTGG